jgi:predicted O-linked N-acetylglucosamine transferase (SPINDLY family)
VAYFTIGIFKHHNAEQFEIYGYHIGTKKDSLTERFQQYAHHWLYCSHLSDEALAEQIRHDQIDILIDLAGHTAHNRLSLFARKPAPIQIAYLGYSETTGVSTIDYRMTDGFADPVNIAEQFSSETLIRMPVSYFCYSPSEESPAVDTLPALSQGYITFGSFNNYKKITPTMLTTWAKILQQVPESRLLIKAKSLNDPTLQQQLKAYFAQFAIVPERIIIANYTASITTHLAIYNQIDIALDTYPYNGATTTCEALWMGVPVVTLVGENHVSRMGLSLLSAVSLTECVADTLENYVHICVKLAKDVNHLQQLRATMRDRMQSSSLLDASTFTHQLEIRYQQLWEKWCVSRTTDF